MDAELRRAARDGDRERYLRLQTRAEGVEPWKIVETAWATCAGGPDEQTAFAELLACADAVEAVILRNHAEPSYKHEPRIGYGGRDATLWHVSRPRDGMRVRLAAQGPIPILVGYCDGNGLEHSGSQDGAHRWALPIRGPNPKRRLRWEPPNPTNLYTLTYTDRETGTHRYRNFGARLRGTRILNPLSWIREHPGGQRAVRDQVRFNLWEPIYQARLTGRDYPEVAVRAWLALPHRATCTQRPDDRCGRCWVDQSSENARLYGPHAGSWHAWIQRTWNELYGTMSTHLGGIHGDE